MKKAPVILFVIAMFLLSCGHSDMERSKYIMQKMDSIKRATARNDSIVLDSIKKETYESEKRRNGRIEYNNRHQLDRSFRYSYY